jgi:bacillithiol system protein YtxJ
LAFAWGIEMGIFDTVKEAFSSSGRAHTDYWNDLDDTSQIEAIISASEYHPQLIYKHSSRCSVCFFAKKQIEDIPEDLREQVDLHFIDVISWREVSNTIAKEFSIKHESPQLLVLCDGEVVWSGSHRSIQSDTITDKLQEYL